MSPNLETVAAKDNSGKNSVPKLLPQPNGGALLSGGVPGNRGGSGRPRSDVRRVCREAFADALPVVVKIASMKVKGQSTSDCLRAVDLLGKYGLGEARLLVPEELLQALAVISVSDFFPTEGDSERFRAYVIDVLKSSF